MNDLYRMIDFIEEEMDGKSDEQKVELTKALMMFLSAYNKRITHQ